MARASASQPSLDNALRIRALSTRSLAEAVEIGDDLAAVYGAAGNTWKLADLRSPMAYFALALGDPEAAMRFAGEGLTAAEHSADAWKVAAAAGNAGLAALLSGHEDQAAGHFSYEVRFFLDHFAWSGHALRRTQRASRGRRRAAQRASRTTGRRLKC